VIRLSFIIPSLILLIYNLIKFPPQKTVVFLTDYGNLFVIICHTLTVIAGLERYRDNKKLKKATLIFMELALCAQVFVVSIYWTLLHNILMDMIKDDRLDEFMTVAIHSVPLATVVSNVFISRVEFRRKDFGYLLAFAIYYAFLNFSMAKFFSFVVYPFMPWEDIRSYLLAAGIILMSQVVHLTLCSSIKKLR
jgi:hypothetical protein